MVIIPIAGMLVLFVLRFPSLEFPATSREESFDPLAPLPSAFPCESLNFPGRKAFMRWP